MFAFAKFCRLCTKNDKYLVDYQQTDIDNISYYDKMKNFLPELVGEHYANYPKWICVTCCEELNQFYMFRKKCYNTHKLLGKYRDQLYSLKLNTFTFNENSHSLPNNKNKKNDSNSELLKEETVAICVFDNDTVTNIVNDDAAINQNSRSNSSLSILNNETPVTEERGRNLNLFNKTVLNNETHLNISSITSVDEIENINGTLKSQTSSTNEENTQNTETEETSENKKMSKKPNIKSTNLQKLNMRIKKRTANIFDSDPSETEDFNLDDDFIESARKRNLKKIKQANTATTSNSHKKNVNLNDNKVDSSGNLTPTKTDNQITLSENYKKKNIYTSGNIAKTIIIDKSKCTKVP